MKYVLGLLLISGGIFSAYRLWAERHVRRSKGILPTSYASIGVDDKGMPATVEQIVRSFIGAWKLYLSIILMAFGSAVLFSGE